MDDNKFMIISLCYNSDEVIDKRKSFIMGKESHLQWVRKAYTDHTDKRRIYDVNV